MRVTARWILVAANVGLLGGKIPVINFEPFKLYY